MTTASPARPLLSPISRLLLALSCTVPALLSTAASAQTAAPAPAAAASAPAPLLTMKDKTSYATGVMTARNLLKNEVPVDLDLIIQGLRDGFDQAEIRLTEKDLKLVLQAMQVDMQRHMTGERQKDAVRNAQRGEVYRGKYRDAAGVVALPGGLLYRVVKEGSGDKPRELSSVVVRYQGKLTDGTEFDATPDGKTATIKLADVIIGWREALKRMPAGSTWEVVVPPTLAYGSKGIGSSIGPNETLVFTIELVAVVQ